MLLRTSKVESHQVLGIRAAGDSVLHQVAALGLAASRGTCLLVDADAESPPLPGATSLEDMAARGIRRSELVPGRQGVAVVSARTMPFGEILELAADFARFWPGIVIRTRANREQLPCVPVVALFPPPLDRAAEGPALYQTCWRGARVPAPGLGLPPLGRPRIRSLLAGVIEPRWGWVRAFRPVWDLPWA